MNTLTEPLGPLKVWQWMAIGTALVAVVILFSKKKKTTTAADATSQETLLAAEEAAAANAAASTTPNFSYGGNGMTRGGGVHSWKPASATTAPTGTTTGTTGTTTGTTPPGTTPAPVPTPAPISQVGTYKAPTGLSSSVKGSTVSITWGLAGQQSPPPGSYTVAIYNSSGKLMSQNTVSVPDTTAGRGTFTTSGLAKGTYHANVWANGGKSGPPHATTNFTIK